MEAFIFLILFVVAATFTWFFTQALAKAFYAPKWERYGREDRDAGWKYKPNVKWIEKLYNKGWDERDKELRG